MDLNQFDIKAKNNELYESLIKFKIPVIEKDKIIKNKLEVIGEGTFGKVYAGKYGNIDVAIKKLKLSPTADLDDILAEINSCTKISHPQIPKFYGVWKTEKYLHLIFDYIKGSNLKVWRQNNSNASLKEIMNMNNNLTFK